MKMVKVGNPAQLTKASSSKNSKPDEEPKGRFTFFSTKVPLINSMEHHVVSSGFSYNYSTCWNWMQFDTGNEGGNDLRPIKPS